MKKKALSLLLVLSLCLTLLPAAALAAEDTGGTTEQGQTGEHTHYLCTTGDDCTKVGGHGEDGKTTFTAWNNTDSLPTASGSYYLTQNVTLSKTWHPVYEGVVLCLNGHSITAQGNFDVIDLYQNDGAALTLTDCQEEQGSITHASGTTGGGVSVSQGTFNMYGGKIAGNKATPDTQGYVKPGGVYVGCDRSKNGVFNMYGGEISGNSAKRGGGVYVYCDYYHKTFGTFNMYGGIITGNNATLDGGDGGGVFVRSTERQNKVVSKITIGGNATITGNVTGGSLDSSTGKYTEGTANNIYLYYTESNYGPTITVNDDFTGAIGVVVNDTNKDKQLVSGNIDTSRITPDDPAYTINEYGLATKKPSMHCSDKHCICGSHHGSGVGDHKDRNLISNWQGVDSLGQITSAGYYYLKEDVTLTSTWIVPATGVVLCLNGHTITGPNADDGDGYAIRVNNQDFVFTLTDCNSNSEQGTITHAAGAKGGGVDVAIGTFNLFGGKITGNTRSSGISGVHIGASRNAIFKMYGGSINNNQAEFGGVSVDDRGIFHMYRGTIENNTATSVGGGVSINGSATFEMSGGTIKNNTAAKNGGGVYVNDSATFKVSGSAQVADNTVDGKANNVYLPSKTTFTLGGSFGRNTYIGVTTQDVPADSSTVPVAAGAEGQLDYSNIIKSDRDEYRTKCSEDKVVLILNSGDVHQHVWNRYVINSADESRIDLFCADDDTPGGWIKLKAPANLKYTGQPIPATLETSPDWKGGTVSADDIWYSDVSAAGPQHQTAPISCGTYRAYLLLGENTACAHIEYTITEDSSSAKTDISDQIHFADGELTYTGAGLKYEAASIQDGYTGSFTYTYAVKGSGSLDTSGLPVAVGTYTVTAAYEDENNFGTKTAALTVKEKKSDDATKPSSGGSSGGGSAVTTYPVNTPSKTQSGSVTSTLKNASKGDTVTITVKPDSGFVLDGLTVTDRSGNALKLTDQGDGKYTFIMPAGKVEVNAAFVPETVSSPFTDVSTDTYYAQPVQWAADQGITGGVSKDSFGPDLSCTRAQIITFLWRAAGSPESGSTVRFSDVSADSYYAKAVAWAVEHGITSGTGSGAFDPDAPCTRAQSVTFLYRALGQLADGQSAFGDVPADSYYADAVAWAVEHGITSGIGGGLFGPDHACTRAQIVTFLYKTYQGA